MQQASSTIDKMRVLVHITISASHDCKHYQAEIKKCESDEAIAGYLLDLYWLVTRRLQVSKMIQGKNRFVWVKNCLAN